MKTIGIEIDKKKVIFVALEKDANGNITNITGSKKYFEVEDDRNREELKQLMTGVHSFFDSIQADRIAIVTRQTKGRFAASPFSFKLEGLIQLYENKEMEFVTPQALTAYFKKNELPLELDHKYQEKAMRLAVFLTKE